MTVETLPLAPELAPVGAGEFDELHRYLLLHLRHCLRPPVDRFKHPWLSPMPLSPAADAYLQGRIGGLAHETNVALARPGTGDGFKAGDYSLGLFHHDASESAIELVRHELFRSAVAGSLLCLLDNAAPNGCVHRSELCHKSRDAEPSKPIIAQFALRVVEAMGEDGPAWASAHQVVERVGRFLDYLEQNYTGLHGLMLTHSALASGFDSDILTAGFPDKSVEGPDTNAFMYLEYRAMAGLLRRMGREPEAPAYEAKAERLKELMEQLLWFEDDRAAGYLALRWQHGVASLDGEIVGHLDLDGQVRPYSSWVTLLPLYAGIPSPARAEKMIATLINPDGYWGPWGVRTAPRHDLFFHQAPRVMLYDHKKSGRGPVSNWSGPVWILSNYYLAAGLARYGRADKARELTLKTARLLAHGLERDGCLKECYDDLSRGLWPRRGTFLSWNVLALTLLRQFCPESTETWGERDGGGTATAADG